MQLCKSMSPRFLVFHVPRHQTTPTPHNAPLTCSLPCCCCCCVRLLLLQGGKKSGGSGRCPFLACGTQAASSLHDHILAQPLDIEELGALGR